MGDLAASVAAANDHFGNSSVGSPVAPCGGGAEGGSIKQSIAKFRRWLAGHFTQQNSNSCVIASTRNMIHTMTGENISEAQLQNEMRMIMGEPDHDFESSPINPEYAVTLLNQHGVQADSYRNMTSDQLPDLLQDGKPALIGFKNPGHRVMLDSVKTDSDGNRTYIVRDPDPAFGGRPRKMSQQDFDAKFNPQAIVIVAR